MLRTRERVTPATDEARQLESYSILEQGHYSIGRVMQLEKQYSNHEGLPIRSETVERIGALVALSSTAALYFQARMTHLAELRLENDVVVHFGEDRHIIAQSGSKLGDLMRDGKDEEQLALKIKIIRSI